MKTAFTWVLGVVLSLSNVATATVYVAVHSPNPSPPYATWATAATNIQEAVDAAPSGALVLVTNGVYVGGVVVGKRLVLMSVNGAQSTAIDGSGTNRCLSLTNNTWVWGFTLTNGYADLGGGVWSAGADCFVTNCVLAGNSASNAGGGAYSGTFYNCLLAGNTALGTGYGGGAVFSRLYNCTVAANAAAQAGGAYQGTLYNCIVYDNTAASEPNYSGGAFNNCCTAPMPASGAGNITNSPLFVSEQTGNFRLQASSPCIDAGNNSYTVALALQDLDGNARIAGNAVDIGAYEYGGPEITLQPVSQTVYAGTNFSFSSGANGAPPLSWQWWFNQSAMADATNSTLTLTALTTNQAGNYWVVVTNSSGAATSQVAVLTVLDSKPSFTVQPVSQSALAGSDVTLTAAAVGSLPLWWQWQYNGGAIPGATGPSLALNLVTTNQAGAYSVVVTNTLGSVTSQVAVLTVSGPASGTKYVWQDSPAPTIPYTTWATAAHTIQDAVDAALDGDVVLVTNGVYNSGSRLGSSGDTARVVVTRVLELRSVNGPQFTTIDGGGTNQCVAMTNGVSLSGFMVTNGVAFSGGGVDTYYPGRGSVSNCVLAANQATFGGGAVGCTLYNCTLMSNSAYLAGGGAAGCTLSNCTLIGNSGDLTNGCAAISSVLYNCVLTGNSSSGINGGLPPAAAFDCSLYSCAITGNLNDGARDSKLYGCTVAGNQGNGAAGGTLYNCIVYYNQGAQGNYPGATLNYCCTTPMPGSGVGNITDAPLFVDEANGDFHLQSNSPCINAGNNAYVSSATDLDGNLRIVSTTVDMGAYEYQSPMPPVITVQPLSQTAWVGTNSSFSVSANGPPPLDWQWWFGGAAIPDATNANLTLPAVRPDQAGAYTVVVSNVFGTATSAVATLTVLIPGTKYVWPDSPAPTAPFTNWATAAHTIQDAVDAAAPGNVILVTNGVYSSVGLRTPIALVSANGPRFTIIDGEANGLGCVSMSGGAMLSGFTLTNGQTWFGTGGGGVVGDEGGTSNAFVTNCFIVNSSAPYGGGAAYCTLYNCTLSGNTGGFGSAALACILYNCTVANNRPGALSQCTLYNCIVYSNDVAGAVNYSDDCILNYCCTMPMPTNGVGNITNAPLFVDAANGDFRIQPDSPCINAGNNLFALTSADLDGNPRISGGTVDIGAYEFQGTALTGFSSWLQSYGLPTDGSADYADSDGDGLNNWQEWVSGTNPTNAQSVLRLLSAVPTGSNMTLTWQSVAGTSYSVGRSTNFGVIHPLAGTNFTVLVTNILGQAGTTSYTDTNAPAVGPLFYRVGVNAP